MYLSIYRSMCACMYVCMYVSIYLFICIHTGANREYVKLASLIAQAHTLAQSLTCSRAHTHPSTPHTLTRAHTHVAHTHVLSLPSLPHSLPTPHPSTPACLSRTQAAALGGIAKVSADDVVAEIEAQKQQSPCLIYTYKLSPFSSEALALLEASGYQYTK